MFTDVTKLNFSHPAQAILLTWFGSGLSARAPGTLGSLATLPFAAVLAWTGGPILLAGFALLVFALGWWAADHYLKRTDAKDPQWIVVDETVGQAIAVCAVPLDPFWYLAAFAAFRFFDIVKPGPVGWADRRIPGALGVMLDDVVAGLLAAVLLAFVRFVLIPLF